MSFGAGALAALGIVVLGALLLLTVGSLLGRRALRGRREGRYTSRPGNSSDNGSTTPH